MQRCCIYLLVLAAGCAAGSLLVALSFIPLMYGVDGDSVSQLVLKAATVVVPSASTTTMTTSTTTSAKTSLFIAVHSAAMGEKYLLRRALWRAYCGPTLKRQGVPYRFFVGLPHKDKRDPDAMVPGQKPTPDELKASNKLLDEYQQYGDVILTPNRDVYRDKSEKVIGWMRYFVAHGERYVQKVDDEYCPYVDRVLLMMRQHDEQKNRSELYGGSFRFRGTEYKNKMTGADGTVSPFISGHTFGVSRNLARYIAETDAVHSLLYSIYGTSSDDANVGKWVHHAQRFGNMSVDLRILKNLTWAVPTNWPCKVNCSKPKPSPKPSKKPSKAAPPKPSKAAGVQPPRAAVQLNTSNASPSAAAQHPSTLSKPNASRPNASNLSLTLGHSVKNASTSTLSRSGATPHASNLSLTIGHSVKNASTHRRALSLHR